MFRIILFFRSRLVLVYFLNGQIFLRLTSFLQTKQPQNAERIIDTMQNIKIGVLIHLYNLELYNDLKQYIYKVSDYFKDITIIFNLILHPLY